MTSCELNIGSSLKGCDAVILAGGLGTRIRSVLGDTPKLLAPVGNRRLIDMMLRRLARLGVERAVLALGHRADAVLAHLESNPPPLPCLPVVEPRPLGTAGALRHLRGSLRPGPALVMNGDTLLDAPPAVLTDRLAQSGAAAALACVHIPDAARFGRVVAGADGFVERFAEKGESGPGLISAGFYALSPAFLDRIAAGDGASLETDYFQKAPPGTLAVAPVAGRFVDIGTPEGFAEGVRLFGREEEESP